MTEPKTDPQEDLKKKRAPLETELEDDLGRDSDPDDEFYGLDESVAEAEEEWEKRAGESKTGLSEEAKLAAVFGLALPTFEAEKNPASTPPAVETDRKYVSLPGEPMRGPLADVPASNWSVNVRDVFGPDGDELSHKPHQEHFKDFGVHMNGREVNLPGTENPVLRLGRNPIKTDLSFADNYVSREHANITREGGKVFITNLQTSNVTTLIRDGKEITVAQSPAKTELLPGDTIRLGRYQELQWMRASDLPNIGKPALYNPKPGEADPAASENARRESNQYLRNHEYGKPFPDGFQNVGGINQIDEKGWHYDNQRPSVVIDQRPGADPALESFVKDMKAKYSHLAGDPRALAEALAREAKTALEPKGWSSAAVDDGYSKLRSENAGKRMLLGDFLNAAKYSKGAGVCNHQAMLTKVAFDNFYPADMPNRPEMKMVRGFYGDSPAGLPPEMAMNHAWNTLTVPNRDGSKGQELIVDPRNRIYGEALAAHPQIHPGKDIPQMRPKDQIPKMIDFKEAPLTASEVERLKGQEVRFENKGWKLKNIDGQIVELSSYGVKSAEEMHLAEANPEAAKSGKWVIGQEYKIKRSSGEIDSGWQLNNVVEVEGKKMFVLGKPDALVRRVMLDVLQSQNGEVFEKVAQERAAHKKAAEVQAPRVVNPESHGFVAGREVFHNGNNWIVQGQDGKNIDLVRAASKTMSQRSFQELNGTAEPKVGNDYLVKRSSGEVETWKLTSIDHNTGELTLRSQTGFREKVSLERLAEQNRSVVGPLDISKVINDPNSKVRLIGRWTDGNSGHDKWIGEVEGPRGEKVSVMVHKPPHGNAREWVRLRNDLAAQELAKTMGAPELFPPTAYRDGMMVQAFVGQQGENIATYLHHRSRQDAELRAAEPDLEKRVQKMLEKDTALRQRIAEGVAFSVLLGDHDQHGLNFVINRDGAGPNDFHVARIDTDYAFSRDKVPVMDQAGNYGSVINGTFAHLSEKELPPDVRAKIKTVSDQLSTPAGREAFQRATNLPKESVEALAERARVMSETGKFPRAKTMAEIRAEFGFGSARANIAPGDVIASEKVGTVKAGTQAPDNLKQSVEQTTKLMRELHAELAKGGPLEGKRLEDVRAKMKELTNLDPTLLTTLQDFRDALNPSKFSGRPDVIVEGLNSSDKGTRCGAIQKEISRLTNLSAPTGAERFELTRMKRELFKEMKEDSVESKELARLYDRQDRGQKLNATEEARMLELEKTAPRVNARLRDNIDFTIKMLQDEAKKNLTSGSTRGGDATQGLIMGMFEKKLLEPRPELGGKSYASLGYEVIPLKASVAMDDAGADFILANKKTGDFMFIDPTQKPLTDESKARLPEIRKQGIISSDPYADKYTDGEKRNVGSQRYNMLRNSDINAQIDNILHMAKEGMPLNLADMIIPPSTREAEAVRKEGRRERFERISKMSAPEKALEIKQWRTELLARQEGLKEMIPLAREQSEQLREQAKVETDLAVKAKLTKQAKLMQDWFQHTEGTSPTLKSGSPLIFIESTLRELDAVERQMVETVDAKLAPDVRQARQDHLRRLARPETYEGQPVQVPQELLKTLQDSAVQLQEYEEMVSGKKTAGPRELAAAADRLSSMYGVDNKEVKALLDLKAQSEYKATLVETGVELTNEYLINGKMTKPQGGKNTAVELALDNMVEKQNLNQTWSDQQLKDFKVLAKRYKDGEQIAVDEVHKRISSGIDSATGGTARAAISKPIAEQTKEQQRATFEEISQAKDHAKLKEFALNTTEPELARKAVQTLRDASPENLIQSLKEIAASNSYATGAALEGLYMETEVGPDHDAFKKLLLDRSNNGEFLEMLKSGKITPEELVSALDKNPTELAGKTVGELLDKLSDNPKLKEQVALAVLKEDGFISKFDPKVGRTFENSSITNETRQKAIDFLAKQTSPESARMLQSVTLDREKSVAEAARKALLERWTTQQQPATGETISELAVGDRLKRYAEEVSKVNWPDGKDLTDLRKRHVQAEAELFNAKWDLAAKITEDPDAQDRIAEKFGDKEYMEKFLKDKPAELAQYRGYLKQEAEAKALAAEYEGILKTRMDVVDAYVKKYCKELGITPPKLEFYVPMGEGKENYGEYTTGKGEIGINDKLVTSGKGPSPEFLSTLFHELGHHEQDTLGVRRLADELKIGKNASADEIQKLREVFSKRYGKEELPDEKFITDTLAKRDGVELTEGQAQRADKLIDAFRQRQVEADQQHELERYAERMTKLGKYLKDNVPIVITLNGDDPVAKAKELLRVKELPAELEAAIKEWKNTPSTEPNAKDVDANLRKLLERSFNRAARNASSEAHSLYRKRAHEVETWDIGARTRFLGNEAVAQNLADVAPPVETVQPVKPGSIRTPTAVRSPMSDEKLKLFIDKVESALPAENFREDLQTRAKEFFSQEGSEAYQRAVGRSLIKLDPALNAGESKLTFTHNGETFTPKSFVAEPAPGRFQTADGKTLDLSECKMEISISAKATAQEAAAAVAAEYNRLALEIQNVGSDASVAKLAEGEAALKSLKERLKVVRNGGEALALSPTGVQEMKLGEAVDLGGRVVEVSLTSEGVRIGNETISNKELLKMAIESKQKLLDKEKVLEERNKLAKEIENLKAIAADVEKGDTRGMREALAKHVPEEIAARRNPGVSVKARVVEGVGKAGAYLMIAAFVASLAVSHKPSNTTNDTYAPLKPR